MTVRIIDPENAIDSMLGQSVPESTCDQKSNTLGSVAPIITSIAETTLALAPHFKAAPSKQKDDANDLANSRYQKYGVPIFSPFSSSSAKPTAPQSILARESKYYGSVVFDVFTHHNQALDVMNTAIKRGDIRGGGILLHFDTHSDIYTNGGNESIANYINTLISDGTVSEIYWVIPEWLKDYPKSANREDRIFFVKDHEVVVHKTTSSELPQFQRGTEIYVDVDTDYFSNTGYDTIGDVSHFVSRSELQKDLFKFSNDLEKRIIKPALIMLSRSPLFAPTDVINDVERYFKGSYGFGQYIEDDSAQYNHGHISELDLAILGDIKFLATTPSAWKNGAGESETGIEVELKARGYDRIVFLWRDFLQHTDDKTIKDALIRAIDQAIETTKARIDIRYSDYSAILEGPPLPLQPLF